MMILGGAQTWHVNEVSGGITVAADITYINIIGKFFVHERNLKIYAVFFFCHVPIKEAIAPTCQ